MTNSFVKRLLTLLYLLPTAKLLYKSLTLNKLDTFLRQDAVPTFFEAQVSLRQALSVGSLTSYRSSEGSLNVSELVSFSVE